ncbi:MAG: M28 family peptidase [Planctomycetota bacterium]
MTHLRRLGFICIIFSGLPALAGQAQEAPIASALKDASPAVVEYNDHVVTLASPFMEGRVPGSRGMQIAKEYVEKHFRDTGLQPAFDGSYRQPFPLGGTLTVEGEKLTAGGQDLVPGADFATLGLGASGKVQAPVVFVGYSIDGGPDGYESFEDGDDLTGKIALMLRFEPMDSSGKSKWAQNAWSPRAGFATKMQAIAKRNPAAVLLVNTPGAADPRVGRLLSASEAGDRVLDIPVLMMSTRAADAFVQNADENGRSLIELRELADEGRTIIPLKGEATIDVTLESKPLMAENVGGILKGKGALADEYVVMGAHLDHLGMGYFGSRSGPGELHPGADDNASGSAAVIMLADRLKEHYESLPDGADARSILFLAFSGEESGLNGSFFYTRNPIVPIEQHAIMVNFDMIGRITNKRLSVSGAQTAEGLGEWLQPMFEKSSLDIVQPANLSGASDHTPFLQAGMPVLFAIIADFHDDYHTPQDVSSKINRVDAVHTIDLFEEILEGLGTRPERFPFVEPTRSRPTANANAGGRASSGPRSSFKVRFGVRPATYDTDKPGIPIASVTEGASADVAGIKDGDRLMKWNGKEIPDIGAWMQMLAKHEPDDKVQVTVLRDGEEMVFWVTLQPIEDSGR